MQKNKRDRRDENYNVDKNVTFRSSSYKMMGLFLRNPCQTHTRDIYILVLDHNWTTHSISNSSFLVECQFPDATARDWVMCMIRYCMIQDRFLSSADITNSRAELKILKKYAANMQKNLESKKSK